MHEVNHLNGAVTKFKIRFYLFKQNFNRIKFFREKVNPNPTPQLGRKEFYPGKMIKGLEHLFGGLREGFKGSICFLLLPVSSKETYTFTTICNSIPFEPGGRVEGMLNAKSITSPFNA